MDVINQTHFKVALWKKEKQTGKKCRKPEKKSASATFLTFMPFYMHISNHMLVGEGLGTLNSPSQKLFFSNTTRKINKELQ